MRIEVEEVVALMSDEVVAAAGSAACDADALRELENCLESYVISRCDFLDAEPNAQDYQGWLELVVCVLLSGGGHERVDVDVAIVRTSVDSQACFVILVCEGANMIVRILPLRIR